MAHLQPEIFNHCLRTFLFAELDNGGIARWKGAEVQLVNAGVGADFGAYLSKMDAAVIRSVLDAAPRTGCVPAF
jgi:hypothetical protein